MISVLRSCQEPGLAPVDLKINDSGSPELPETRPGSGEPKVHDFGSPEKPRARAASGEPKKHDFGSPELPRARSGSGDPNNESFRFSGAARSQVYLQRLKNA